MGLRIALSTPSYSPNTNMNPIVAELIKALQRLIIYMPADKAEYAEQIKARIERAAEAEDQMSLDAISIEIAARSEEHHVEIMEVLKSILDSIIKAGVLKLGG